jgi:hypothetical protein
LGLPVEPAEFVLVVANLGGREQSYPARTLHNIPHRKLLGIELACHGMTAKLTLELIYLSATEQRG